MRILSRIETSRGGIDFGVASDERERDEVFRQRLRVYGAKGYYREGVTEDMDEYDADAVFFVARQKANGDKIIGSCRVIRGKDIADFRFPAQHAHDFDMPPAFGNTALSKIIEIGRMVSERPAGVLPLVIPIGLISAIVNYSKANGIIGGISTIKQRLLGHLEAARLPFHEIPFRRLSYPRDGLIASYYYKDSDPAVPVYYLLTEAEPAINEAVSALDRRASMQR